MKSKRYLTPRDFATAVGISPKTVQRRLKAGQLPAMQPGGPNTAWLIDYDAFAAAFSAAPAQHAAGNDEMAGGDAADLTQARSALEEQDQVTTQISGPRPRWMQSLPRKT